MISAQSIRWRSRRRTRSRRRVSSISVSVSPSAAVLKAAAHRAAAVGIAAEIPKTAADHREVVDALRAVTDAAVSAALKAAAAVAAVERAVAAAERAVVAAEREAHSVERARYPPCRVRASSVSQVRQVRFANRYVSGVGAIIGISPALLQSKMPMRMGATLSCLRMGQLSRCRLHPSHPGPPCPSPTQDLARRALLNPREIVECRQRQLKN